MGISNATIAWIEQKLKRQKDKEDSLRKHAGTTESTQVINELFQEAWTILVLGFYALVLFSAVILLSIVRTQPHSPEEYRARAKRKHK
jgi:hypothetical protein